MGDTSQNYRKGQLVDLINTQMINESKIEHVEQLDDPRDYRVSFDKIHRELGFHVTRTVEDGVRQVVEAIEKGLVGDPYNPLYRN